MQRYDLIFPEKFYTFYTGFYVVVQLHNKNPIKAQKNMKKWLKGAALKLLLGFMRPGPCEPEFWKNDLPANLFLLYVLPQSVRKLHRLFNISTINTHFDMFLKN